ncbi:hypothetical protein DFH28DRAFT_910733, partial [Melampsora americana]
AKLASSLDNPTKSLRTQAKQALNHNQIRAQSVAAHNAAKVEMLRTAVLLDQQSLALKHTNIPSQEKAMKIFNKHWQKHFTDNKAATEAIILFENKEKCHTFVNLDPVLRCSWLALSLGYHIVKEFEDEKEKEDENENEDEDEDEDE